MTPRQWLVVMVRLPVAGRVKTRLARSIGAVAATSFYRHATAGLLRHVNRPRAWTTVLAVTPDTERTSPVLPPGLARRPQGRGNLGDRLQRILDELPPGPVAIIGTDVPGIRARQIAAAFRLLGSADAVFGPSPDGGYWLIGMRRRPRCRPAFAGVRWSSRHALADTARNLRGARIAYLEPLHDIDEAAGFMAHRKHLGRAILPPG